MRTLRFPIVLSFVVLVAHAAFAQELRGALSFEAGVNPQSSEQVQPHASRQRDVAPLFFVLPPFRTNAPATMEIRILQGKRQLVSEVVKLPARIPSGAVVDVLLTHADELKGLRAIEIAHPGSLRFLALAAGKTVADEPFAAIEARGAKLSRPAAVGEVVEVEARPASKLRLHALDECTDYCDQQYMSCLDSCDERSNSCQQCWLDYQSCSSSCGPGCTEPKSTSDYTTNTVLSYAYYGTHGCYSPYHPTSAGEIYEEWYLTVQVTTFHRVEHCDGSYTDTQTSQYNTSYWCWYDTHSACGSSTGFAPNPQC